MSDDISDSQPATATSLDQRTLYVYPYTTDVVMILNDPLHVYVMMTLTCHMDQTYVYGCLVIYMSKGTVLYMSYMRPVLYLYGAGRVGPLF